MANTTTTTNVVRTLSGASLTESCAEANKKGTLEYFQRLEKTEIPKMTGSAVKKTEALIEAFLDNGARYVPERLRRQIGLAGTQVLFRTSDVTEIMEQRDKLLQVAKQQDGRNTEAAAKAKSAQQVVQTEKRKAAPGVIAKGVMVTALAAGSAIAVRSGAEKIIALSQPIALSLTEKLGLTTPTPPSVLCRASQILVGYLPSKAVMIGVTGLCLMFSGAVKVAQTVMERKQKRGQEAAQKIKEEAAAAQKIKEAEAAAQKRESDLKQQEEAAGRPAGCCSRWFHRGTQNSST